MIIDIDQFCFCFLKDHVYISTVGRLYSTQQVMT